MLIKIKFYNNSLHVKIMQPNFNISCIKLQTFSGIPPSESFFKYLLLIETYHFPEHPVSTPASPCWQSRPPGGADREIRPLPRRPHGSRRSRPPATGSPCRTPSTPASNGNGTRTPPGWDRPLRRPPRRPVPQRGAGRDGAARTAAAARRRAARGSGGCRRVSVMWNGTATGWTGPPTGTATGRLFKVGATPNFCHSMDHLKTIFHYA